MLHSVVVDNRQPVGTDTGSKQRTMQEKLPRSNCDAYDEAHKIPILYIELLVLKGPFRAAVAIEKNANHSTKAVHC